MNLKPLKILVADDDPEDLELIEEHILSVDPLARLDKFADGMSAYEFLLSQPESELPSLIILDYDMPGLSGCQVLLSMRSMNRFATVPKIILSGSSTTKYIEECMRNGATEYIVKPSSMKEIRELAKKLVSMAAANGRSPGNDRSVGSDQSAGR